jgi:undecaprenyl-diphosphatase
LTLGALVLVAASWLFAEIADDVINGKPITLVDAKVTTWLHTHAVPGVTTAMLLITHLHGLAGTGVLAALLGALLAWRREWYWLLTLALAVPGGMLVNMLAKLAFQRARPSVPDPLLILATYSFPSGHVAAATCFYGVVVALVFAQVEPWRLRAAAVVGAVLVVALIALSRVYLGVHYLSDVLAAFAEGIAWVAICLMAVHTLRVRRAACAHGR